MRIEAIQDALKAAPFVPFRFILPSDRAVPVPHPDFVSIAPNPKVSFFLEQARGVESN